MEKTQLEKALNAVERFDVACGNHHWQQDQGHDPKEVSKARTAYRRSKTHLINQIKKLNIDNSVGRKVS